MNKETAEKILSKIKEYDKIIITRHFRPDGDAVGSSMGLQRILRATYPEKTVLLINEDYSNYVSFLGDEDSAISDEEYADALVIVTDTATEDRISNKKYKLGREVIKIDHHIDAVPFGDIYLVDENISSACELIVEFYLCFKNELVMTKEAATCLFTGMVTDTGRFSTSSVTSDTLRNAAVLLDTGIETEPIFTRLSIKDFNELKFRAYIFKKMKITENGVAYLYVSQKMQKKFGLSREDAIEIISMMNSIKNSIIWLAFIENEDKTVRVRLRSRFVTVNELASKYHGGGHDRASGATVYSRKEMTSLLTDADALIRDYKKNNEGWM